MQGSRATSTEIVGVRLRVAAPRAYVFSCLSTFNERSPVWVAGFPPELLAHDGDDLIVRLRTRRLGRVVAGIHRVHLEAPDRVLFQLLEGALGSLDETLVLESDGDATWLSWQADLALALPAAGLLARFLAGPMLVAEARRTLSRHKLTIEAAALASRRTVPAARPDHR